MPTTTAADLSATLAELLEGGKQRVAVAESLTSGRIATQLGAAPGSSDWFAGGVVAYASDVKFGVLGVEPGPVVSARCAEQMARGVAELTQADVAVAVTGVGGPDRQEDQPVGTVFIGVYAGGKVYSEHHDLGDEVEEILDATTVRALELVVDRVRALA
ncbi:CinA family protein [Georgenia faecalis]|uniref:CinA family protein n=1 Tax=Georgenia faecalis TaxID=2483799 RepID=A0ABV9DAU1_9MICO|nr:CinA family protein [Georgenia faecalis]